MLGLTPDRAASRLFGDASSLAVQLYRSGLSIRQVSRIMGKSHMTVYRMLRGKVMFRPRVPEVD